MKYTLMAAVMCFGLAAAAEKKNDWKPCEPDIAKYCAAAKDDHEKHECLEKAGKNLSKECRAHNSKAASHKDNHKDEHKGHSH